MRNNSFEAKDVSVVIPTVRGGDDLSRALNSVIPQNVHKIIVVFNGSNANEMHYSFVSKNKFTTQTNIKFLILPEISSAPLARNFGMNEVTSTLVHFLDDDDWVEPNFYDQLTKLFTINCIGVVSSVIVHDDIDLTVKDKSIKSLSVIKRNLLICDNKVGVTSGVILKSNYFRLVGGFDDKMPARQDYLLWIALSEYGDFIATKDCLLHWVDHSSTLSISNSDGISKHIVAIDLLSEVLDSIIANESKSILKIMRKSKAARFKYLCRISLKQGNLNLAILYLVKSLLMFPTLSVISLFLPKKIKLLMRKLF
jgi:glycosyltransferase involved in cell wall biosynthesis